MSIDITQFYQVFFEETGEHLASMESLLLDLDIHDPDPEALNAIFRAAHSIKGGAATFGFSDMAEVTHELETLLDRLRKNELPLRAEMVDAFLMAGDVLNAQLAAHQEGVQTKVEDAGKVCILLRELAQGSSAPAAGSEPVALPSSPSPAVAPPAQVVASSLAAFKIQFIAVTTQLPKMLDTISALGQLEVIEQKPTSGDMSSCQLILHSSEAVSLASISESLAFIVDPNVLSVESVEPQAISSPSSVVEDTSYGFFEPLPHVQAVSNTDTEQGYGFFEPLPEQAVVSEGGKGALLEDGDGYGFFEPLETPSSERAPTPSSVEKPSQPVQDVLTPSVLAAPAAQLPIEMPAASGVTEAKKPAPTAIAKPTGERPAASPEASSIRVSVEKVDQLLNLVGELVITQSMLAQTASRLDPIENENMLTGIVQLERNTRELQDAVMSIRMIPISFVFNRFPRVVRDLANKLTKQVELKMIGENTELDKGFIEKLADPLTHIVRNSLDHGIELPEERVAKGKSPTGTLTLRAFHQGGNIVIEVRDDGAGLHRERILSKARERGMPVSDTMLDAEVWALIFDAGFSTAAQITDVSGRGVGMDVVRKNIQAMGGRVDIESVFGVGTSMIIRLPLTLAILDGMSIAVGDETYIIPLTFIVESLQPMPIDVKTMAGRRRVLHIRGEYLPLIALHDIFNITPRITEIDKGLVVILEADGGKIALFVDDLLGQHQVVIKNLETNYRRVQGISGATIMGDGRVAMILDVAGLVRMGLSTMQGRSV